MSHPKSFYFDRDDFQSRIMNTIACVENKGFNEGKFSLCNVIQDCEQNYLTHTSQFRSDGQGADDENIRYLRSKSKELITTKSVKKIAFDMLLYETISNESSRNKIATEHSSLSYKDLMDIYNADYLHTMEPTEIVLYEKRVAKLNKKNSRSSLLSRIAKGTLTAIKHTGAASYAILKAPYSIYNRVITFKRENPGEITQLAKVGVKSYGIGLFSFYMAGIVPGTKYSGKDYIEQAVKTRSSLLAGATILSGMAYGLVASPLVADLSWVLFLGNLLGSIGHGLKEEIKTEKLQKIKNKQQLHHLLTQRSLPSASDE